MHVQFVAYHACTRGNPARLTCLSRDAGPRAEASRQSAASSSRGSAAWGDYLQAIQDMERRILALDPSLAKLDAISQSQERDSGASPHECTAQRNAEAAAEGAGAGDPELAVPASGAGAGGNSGSAQPRRAADLEASMASLAIESPGDSLAAFAGPHGDDIATERSAALRQSEQHYGRSQRSPRQLQALGDDRTLQMHAVGGAAEQSSRTRLPRRPGSGRASALKAIQLDLS
jgi:hypothetical protein